MLLGDLEEILLAANGVAPRGLIIPWSRRPLRKDIPQPDRTGALRLAVALVRAGSVRYREPLVAGGRERSPLACGNPRSQGTHRSHLGRRTRMGLGSNPTSTPQGLTRALAKRGSRSCRLVAARPRPLLSPTA